MGEQQRTPVTTADELVTLDGAEILDGYHAGFDGDPEPGGNRSKAYWHGWRNGHHDRTGGPPDSHGIELIRDCRRVWGNDVLKWGTRHG